MVTRDSAIHPKPEEQDDIFSIDANHSEIVKFANSACPDYNNVRSRIIRLVEDGQVIIKKRYECQLEGMLRLDHKLRPQGSAYNCTRDAESTEGGYFEFWVDVCPI